MRFVSLLPLLAAVSHAQDDETSSGGDLETSTSSIGITASSVLATTTKSRINVSPGSGFLDSAASTTPWPETSRVVPQSSTVSFAFYVPYPVSDVDTEKESATPSATDRYWAHAYRDYYVSIITTIETSTVVFRVGCAPNSKHRVATSNDDFNTASVCAHYLVGDTGGYTVTQAPDYWGYWSGGMNVTRSVRCKSLDAETKTCTFVRRINSRSPHTMVLPGGPTYDGALSALEEYMPTMTEAVVKVTEGLDMLPSSSKFFLFPFVPISLKDEHARVLTAAVVIESMQQHAIEVYTSSINQNEATRTDLPTFSSTAAAARVTGAVRAEALFGAAGVLGAAIFGL